MFMQPHIVGPRADGSMLLRKGTPEPPALQDNPGWAMTLHNKAYFLFIHGDPTQSDEGRSRLMKWCCSPETK